MALRSSPKELEPNAGCRDCFLTAQGWMFGAVLDSPKLNLGIFFRTVWNQNYGIALGSLGTDLGPKLVHVYFLGVIAKMNNMIGCLKIMLLRYAQLMY